MILKQYYLNCLAHASYLIGDEDTRTAVIVDPQRDVEQYIDECAERGLQIRHVFLTHCHADFVAGHLELRDRAAAKIYMGAQARAEYSFVPMKDGDELELGSVRLKVLETPGHTMSDNTADLLIRARWIVPVNPAGQVLEHATLAIKGGRIIGIHANDAAHAINATQVLELPHHALLPGLFVRTASNTVDAINALMRRRVDAARHDEAQPRSRALASANLIENASS